MRATKATNPGCERHMRSMLIYARLLGQAWNVSIRFANVPTAATNGQVILLPYLDLGSDEDVELMEGLIDHEAGVHVRYTEFEQSAKRLEAAPAVTRALANIFEDVWGEREVARTKPGCARAISRALEIMCARGLFHGPKSGSHVSADLVNTLLHGLRSQKLGQTILDPTYRAYREVLESKIGADNTAALWQTACKVDRVLSTEQAIDLAEEVTGLLASMAQPQPQAEGGAQSETESDDDGAEDDDGSGGNRHDRDGAESAESSGADDGGDGQQEGQGQGQCESQATGGQDRSSAAARRAAGESDPGDTESDPSDGSDGARGQDPAGQSEAGAPQQGSQGAGGGKSGQSGPASPQGTGSREDHAQQGDQPGDQPGDRPVEQPGEQTPQGQSAHPVAREVGNQAEEQSKREQLDQIEQILQASLQESGSGELADSLVAALTGRDPSHCLTDPADRPDVQVGSGAGSHWDIRVRTPLTNASVSSELDRISRPIAVQLGSKLDELLVARTFADVEYRRSGTRLESHLLPAVVTEGRLDVFRRTEEMEAIDTAVLLLTDVSGSMWTALGDDVSAIEAAGATTRALGDTLERFDVPFAIRYFGEALTHVKSFGEPWRRAKERHWAGPEGSTCTHQALYSCVPELGARDEQRKLLVLATDGVPSSTEHTVAALLEGMRAGIQPAVVLIAAREAGPTESFARTLQQYRIPVAWARTPQTLAKAVFDAVKATLADSHR
jgi:cobalamin biosynthesis protein CobT